MNNKLWEWDEGTTTPRVIPPGYWDNDEGPKDWWAIADADGIKAYACTEEMAERIAEIEE